MKAKKTVNGSSCSKSKLFDSLSGKDVSEIDPSYKLFLEHLRKDGNTYVLDVPDGDHGMPVSVRYGEDGASDGNAKNKDGPNSPNGSLHRTQCVPNGKRPGVKAGKAASGNVGHSFSPKTLSVKKKKKKTSAVDESYGLFLSLVKFKDGFMVIEPEPGVTIVYEQEEETPAGHDELRTGSSTNDQEPLMSPLENMGEEYAMHACEDGLGQSDKSTSLDSQDVICTDERGLVLYTEPSDLNACEDDQGAPLALCSGGSSTFDEKLNAILSQPYDQNEYEELWRKATDRKPVSRQRHLRSASKRYVTEAIGLSYLDYYPG
ncbi:uncharacterized protein LOC133884331 isoform X2 [Phragmites australis]|uniref:uncharacterized protein LOC133884331 isoform X2 n=1 Tax=Phragmites australis TaxID=29695 RepID=UPI002D777CF5|nr:uncharacterized protein LOC133884331 isoform X2 [Phragmites australis]